MSDYEGVKMFIEKMTRDEKSLLIYFEHCMVDAHGCVDNRKMNADDYEIAKRWTKEGFVHFCRIDFSVGL